MNAYTGNARRVAELAAAEARLVVIDPEDIKQVKRLWDAFADEWLDTRVPIQTRRRPEVLQAALREFANPKREAFEHMVAEEKVDGVVRSLCGKVWKPDRSGTVNKGRCPECEEIVKAGWVL